MSDKATTTKARSHTALCLSLMGLSGLALEAQAQTVPYVRADVFLTQGGKAPLKASSPAIDKSLTNQSDLGFGFGAGVSLQDRFRLELEASGRKNKLNQNIATLKSIELDTESVMLNAFYDLPRMGDARPYIGLGIGQAKTSLTALSTTNTTLLSGDVDHIAAQAMAGVGWRLNDRINLDLGYRYFNAAKADFTPSTGTGFSVGRDHHAVTFGLRIALGGIKPPKLPKPKDKLQEAIDNPSSENIAALNPPTNSRGQTSLPTGAGGAAAEQALDHATKNPQSFVVYFDHNKSHLSTEARSVINKAATVTQNTGPQSVEVRGHTDLSGSNAYNLILSRKRAVIVATELVNKGVSPDIIKIDFAGETAPAVNTPDGVREALNRRTEIELSY